jgi:hypothetical protein
MVWDMLLLLLDVGEIYASMDVIRYGVCNAVL